MGWKDDKQFVYVLPVFRNFLSSVLPRQPWTVCKQLYQLLWATQAERNKINTASNNKRISSFHFSSCPIYIVLGSCPCHSTIFSTIVQWYMYQYHNDQFILVWKSSKIIPEIPELSEKVPKTRPFSGSLNCKKQILHKSWDNQSELKILIQWCFNYRPTTPSTSTSARLNQWNSIQW